MSNFSYVCKPVPCYVLGDVVCSWECHHRLGNALSLFRKVCYCYCLLYVPERQTNLTQEHGVPDCMIRLYIDHNLKCIFFFKSKLQCFVQSSGGNSTVSSWYVYFHWIAHQIQYYNQALN